MDPDVAAKPAATPAAGAPAVLDDALWSRLDASLARRHDRLVKFRRRIHATPESSGSEVHTTALVASTLREAGLEPRIGQDDVGIIADLDVGAGDSFIALRAELDAVQVNDEKQAPYASTVPGLCHACGHDAHSTIVLATAAVLQEEIEHLRRAGLKHNVRFIFQPAEESATGARSMIKQGAIDGVEAIIALHAEPFLEVGVIGLRRGPLTSGCKSVHVTVRGRSGHSARPHEAIDPIPAAVALTSLMYQLCPRSVDARHPMVLTIASMRAGSSFNGIPDEAELMGTLRTTRVEDTEVAQRRIESIVSGVAQSTGCEILCEFLHHCPPTDNDPHLVDALAAAAGTVLGPEGVHWLELPSLGAEDFAFYQELIPGAIVRLGVGLPEPRTRWPLHSSHFDLNEEALPVGARFFTRAALALAAGYDRRGP